MSSEGLPRLGRAIPTFELFMRGWEKLAADTPRLKPWIDKGLRWARQYYTCMDDTNSFLLAMCE
jgi:hypothetical protein